MCGISGILRQNQVHVEEIIDLTRSINHRGPNGVHYWQNAKRTATLGHARLSIIDLSSAADQPMTSSNGRFVIAYNGEVFNYRELAFALSSRGYTFRTTSDTEVVLAAYEMWGEDAFSQFNGMWAFAIYDSHDSSIILVRDRYGIKPLYYYLDKNTFVFCSEIQSIAKWLGCSANSNDDYFSRLLQYDLSIFCEESTHIQGIKSVLPAQICRISNDLSFSERKWYKLQRISVPNKLEDQATELRSLLSDSCRLRLRSDLPVATCLSGGIDSGAVSSLLASLQTSANPEITNFSYRSFTASFPGTSMDESEIAISLAKQKGLEHNLHVIECPNASELEEAMTACDGPMPALSFYPIWRLYRHIKQQGISVTLDGQGADEMLGGYFIAYESMKGAYQLNKPLWLADLFFTYRSLNEEARTQAWKDLWKITSESASDLIRLTKSPLKQVLKKAGLLTSQTMTIKHLESLHPSVDIHDPDVDNILARALWRQFFQNPLPFLLFKYDRCSMANGVECRMPFMDHRLVEYIFSLPLTSRVGAGYTKRVLRDSLKGILPETIRTNRTKKGFNAPFKEWLAGPLRTWTHDLINSQCFRQNRYFDGELLRSHFLSSEKHTSPCEEWNIWPYLHTAWWLARIQNI